MAANRYEHLDTVVKPNLKKGISVISDRYFPSSLVYQQMDGVEKSFIQNLNKNILEPDLTIILIPDEATLKTRIAKRSDVTRFERNSADELRLYQEAAIHLRAEGWNVLIIDSATTPVNECALLVMRQITLLD